MMVILKEIEKKDTVVSVTIPDENGGIKKVDDGGLRTLRLKPVTTLQPIFDKEDDKYYYPLELEKFTRSKDSDNLEADLLSALLGATDTKHGYASSSKYLLWMTYEEYLTAAKDLNEFYEKHMTDRDTKNVR